MIPLLFRLIGKGAAEPVPKPAQTANDPGAEAVEPEQAEQPEPEQVVKRGGHEDQQHEAGDQDQKQRWVTGNAERIQNSGSTEPGRISSPITHRDRLSSTT